jgi:hypothetical protein
MPWEGDTAWKTDSLSKVSIEMSGFGKYISWKLLFRCDITGKIWKNFFGPWKLLKLSLSAKYKNLQSSSSLSLVITSPNRGVEMTLFVVKYDLRVGSW